MPAASCGSIPPATITPAQAGFHWHVGDTVGPTDLDRVAETMADELVAAIAQRPMPDNIAQLYLTDPIESLGRIDGIMLSGGVGEYVYGRETRDFGDMGRRLGAAIRARIDSGALPWPLLPAGECIRATALGASEYSVQLSGNTCTITNPGALLPRRNLQVVQPPYEFAEEVEPEAIGKAIRSHLIDFDLIEGESEVALAFRLQGPPSHERLFAFARGICLGMPKTMAAAKAALHHARRRRGADARRGAARGTGGRKRNRGDRRRAFAGLRLCRSRPASASPR